jgi:hypothetical protein
MFSCSLNLPVYRYSGWTGCSMCSSMRWRALLSESMVKLLGVQLVVYREKHLPIVLERSVKQICSKHKAYHDVGMMKMKHVALASCLVAFSWQGGQPCLEMARLSLWRSSAEHWLDSNWHNAHRQSVWYRGVSPQQRGPDLWPAAKRESVRDEMHCGEPQG